MHHKVNPYQRLHVDLMHAAKNCASCSKAFLLFATESRVWNFHLSYSIARICGKNFISLPPCAIKTAATSIFPAHYGREKKRCRLERAGINYWSGHSCKTDVCEKLSFHVCACESQTGRERCGKIHFYQSITQIKICGLFGIFQSGGVKENGRDAQVSFGRDGDRDCISYLYWLDFLSTRRPRNWSKSACEKCLCSGCGLICYTAICHPRQPPNGLVPFKRRWNESRRSSSNDSALPCALSTAIYCSAATSRSDEASFRNEPKLYCFLYISNRG
jgi:hypothetical protein